MLIFSLHYLGNVVRYNCKKGKRGFLTGKEMKKMKEYEVVGKDYNEDWWTIKSGIKTKQEAIRIAKKQNNKEYQTIDINLIIDDDLKETYDENGNVR